MGERRKAGGWRSWPAAVSADWSAGVLGTCLRPRSVMGTRPSAALLSRWMAVVHALPLPCTLTSVDSSISMVVHCSDFSLCLDCRSRGREARGAWEAR